MLSETHPITSYKNCSLHHALDIK